VIGAVSFVGASPFGIPAASVSVTVDTTTTLETAGALDWHGRVYCVTRPDGVVIRVWRNATSHTANDAEAVISFSDDYGATWTADNTDLDGNPVGNFPMNAPTGNIMIGEAMPFYAPNGDLLLHVWSYTGTWSVNAAPNYCWQSRSTDGGLSWSIPTQIAYGGSTNDIRLFSTDQTFIVDDVIYAGARSYTADDGSTGNMLLATSEDNGATWNVLSSMLDTTDVTGGGQEVAISYIAPTTIKAYVRDNAHTHFYTVTSTDMGATWAAPVDTTATFGIAGRQKVYTRAFLRGQANWWKDPVRIMVGFVHQTPGSSQGRRNGVWISRDFEATWSAVSYVDTTNDDGGYGDIFYDPTSGQYVMESYRGTLAAADQKQYRLTIAGI
jgi:hypothetical protein